jgi:hypothetical protein
VDDLAIAAVEQHIGHRRVDVLASDIASRWS